MLSPANSTLSIRWSAKSRRYLYVDASRTANSQKPLLGMPALERAGLPRLPRRGAHGPMPPPSSLELGPAMGSNPAMNLDARTDDLLVVLCTVPSDTVAESIATALVTERLAACVSIVQGVRSVYRWKGDLCRDDELQLVIKTTQPRLDELAARVHALHPYETPELICLPITTASSAYAAWLRGETAR